jgi:hypothetical protein
MFWSSKDVHAAIVRVASAEDEDRMRELARAVAAELGPRFLKKATVYAPPPKPPELAGRYEEFGDWTEACQAAVFEVAYHLGAQSLRFVRRWALGAYDWSQAYATDALCRLALDGVDQERTARDIAKHLPRWRYEQVMNSRHYVAQLAAVAPVLQAALDTLIEGWKKKGDPVDAFLMVAAVARADRARGAAHLPFLHGLARGEGLEGRTPLDDGEVVTLPGTNLVAARSGPAYPSVPDFHRIRAAVLILEIDPHDQEARRQVAGWAETHPSAEGRKELREILADLDAGPR